MKVHYNDLYSVRSSEIIKSAKQGKNLSIDFTNICALGASCLDRLGDILPLENVMLVNISSFILNQFDEFFGVNYHLAENHAIETEWKEQQATEDSKERLDMLRHSELDDCTIQLTFF